MKTNEYFAYVSILSALSLLSGCTGIVDLGDLPEESATEGTEGTDTMVPTSSGSDTGGSGSASDSGTSGGDTGGSPSNKVDILFVVDNSGSMGAAQASVTTGIHDMVDRLEEQGLDWRVAVTTTDNGNPWCLTDPEEGRFVASSCRERQDDFVFLGATEVDVTQEACLDVCSFETLALQPTTTDTDPVPAIRPWLQGGEQPNFEPGTSAGDVLGCMIPQGINGCGFEQPLEAMHIAMTRAQSGSEAEYGFLRSDADLAIIVISDEMDCSHTPQHESIFLPDGGKIFWHDPEETQSPTSAVCFNAAVQCSGGPGVYDECHAASFDATGSPTVVDDAAVIRPLGRYDALLDDVASQKEPGAEIWIFGIVGVPSTYVDGASILYEDAADPIDQANFGIGPTCSGAAVQGRPPVRLLELSEDYVGERTAYSICDETQEENLIAIVDRIAAG